MIVIGIDPGVMTGYAEWDTESHRLVVVTSMKIHAAMWSVLALSRTGNLSHVVFEDARLRTWFGKSRSAREDSNRLMGAGSVRRDSTIWDDFLSDAGIEAIAISPKEKGAKYTSSQFERATGWTRGTNEHGRDAGLLVIGTKAKRREQ